VRLKDKVALITGAGSGMGRATATLFAREGAKVAVVDVNLAGAEDTVRRITTAGGQAIAIRADVSNSEDASSMVSGTVAKFGGLDIIYNNAGIEGEGRFIAEVTEEQLRDLADFESSPQFSEEERLVLRLAVQLTRTPANVADSLYEGLRRCFSEPELAELTAVIAWENYRARFNRTFAVEAEGFSKGNFCPLPEI